MKQTTALPVTILASPPVRVFPPHQSLLPSRVSRPLSASRSFRSLRRRPLRSILSCFHPFFLPTDCIVSPTVLLTLSRCTSPPTSQSVIPPSARAYLVALDLRFNFNFPAINAALASTSEPSASASASGFQSQSKAESQHQGDVVPIPTFDPSGADTTTSNIKRKHKFNSKQVKRWKMLPTNVSTTANPNPFSPTHLPLPLKTLVMDVLERLGRSQLVR
jgi:hypothetical protein